MKKSASAVSVIGGADGPTSIFFKKNAKLTLKQKIQRAKNKIKRFYVDKTLSCESHSLDEVIEWIDIGLLKSIRMLKNFQKNISR